MGSLMRKKIAQLILCVAVMLVSSPAFAMAGAKTGVHIIDPPAVLSNGIDKALIVKWQTSVPGVAASPVEEHVLAAGTKDDRINHANFWVTEVEASGERRSVPNMIEVWVYAEDASTLPLSSFRTFQNLYPEDLKELDKTVILEIDISSQLGINVKLETFR